MSRIDDLITQLCPVGVPHRSLGDVGTFVRGNGLQKSDLTDAGFPAIHYGQIHTYYGTWAVSTKSFTDTERSEKLRRAKSGDLIIATTSEDDEAVAKATAWLGNGEVAVSGDAFIYRHSLSPKYVAYFFQSDQFQKQKALGITGTKVRRISGDRLARVRIPVPPLVIQDEIVDILDKMSQLQAELQAELQARRSQYEFYRDTLLTFPVGILNRVPMGDLGSIFGGLTGKSKSDFANGNAPYVSYMNIFSNIAVPKEVANFVQVTKGERQKSLQKGDILFTGSSETPGDVAMSSVVTSEVTEPLYLNSFSMAFRLNDPTVLDAEFSKHLFRSSEMRKQLVKTASGVTRFNVSKARLAKVEVPIPALADQRRIASLLDNFEHLTNDLSIGIPAEITARRRQYEYYRDRLLTFEEAVE